MNARGILMSGPMVRALLDGRKTQTRRVVKPQPHQNEYEPTLLHWFVGRKYLRSLTVGLEQMPNRCPYGKPGDLLYVRETHSRPWEDGDLSFGCFYRADYPDGRFPLGDDIAYWTPSIHMPRKFSRLTLRLTDVRVERVQEISREDAIAEGIPCLDRLAQGRRENEIGRFSILWDSIYAKRGYSWDSNPWVWVLTFDVIAKNVDDVIREDS